MPAREWCNSIRGEAEGEWRLRGVILPYVTDETAPL
jgi:hypothetical protein